jgi:hypothetical protein
VRIQPRAQILNVWKTLISTCYQDGTWQWGGRDGANSISDAEQLLCLLYPATEINVLALDRPDAMAEDVKDTLQAMGGATRIGEVVVRVLEEYIDNHTDPEGEPEFAAGSYLRANDGYEPTEEQRGIEVVDSYSMSLTLCIAALGFLRVFTVFAQAQTYDEAKELVKRIDVLSEKISTRLTAAMVGLLRSFVVNTVSTKSEAGQTIIRMLNQTGQPPKVMAENIMRGLDPVRTQLRGIKLAMVPGAELGAEDMLFECGWTWGIAREADTIDFVQARIAGQSGSADPRPATHPAVGPAGRESTQAGRGAADPLASHPALLVHGRSLRCGSLAAGRHSMADLRRSGVRLLQPRRVGRTDPGPGEPHSQ